MNLMHVLSVMEHAEESDW